MSRDQKPRGHSQWEREEARRHRRRGQRHPRRTCGDPPQAPTNAQTIWETTDGGRFDRIRGRFRWDEVTLDTAGLDTRVRRYIVQVQHSKDQVNWSEPDRRVVPAKDDDANTTAHVIVRGIHKRLFYRWRVRAEDRHGCRSEWAGWFPSALGENPVDPDAPPAPTNVTLEPLRRGTGLRAEWDLAEDPLDTDPDVRVVDPRIAHVQYQLATDPGFGAASIVKRGRLDAKERVAFHNLQEELTYYFRVRTLNAEGTKSAWVAAPVGVSLEDDLFWIHWSIHGQLQVREIKKHWVVPRPCEPRKARIYVGHHKAATHPNDGAPTGSPVRCQLRRLTADEANEMPMLDTDDRLVVPAGKHKDVNFASSFSVTRLEKNDEVWPDIRSVGSTFAGEDATIQLGVRWL